MTASKPTKPSLETCAELVRAAQTVNAKAKMLNLAYKHGHSAKEIHAYLCIDRTCAANKTAAKAEGEVIC